MRNTKNLVALSLLTAVIAAPAFAQEDPLNERGWYIGGAIGVADNNNHYKGYDLSENSSNFIVYGGYNFNQWFGIESAFTVTDQYRYKDAEIKGGFGAFSVTPKLTGRVSDKLSFYAKAGIASMAYVENYRDDGWGDDETTWSGVNGTVGIGAQVDLTQNVKLRISYDYYKGTLENDDFDYDDIDFTSKQTSIGLHYQF